MLAGAMGLLPIVPPEHIHETEEDGRHHLVVHQHLQSHELLEHFGDASGAFDDDDAPILTLPAVFTVTPPILIAAPVLLAVEFVEPPIATSYERPIDDVEILIHGPPRAPTGLRAPPSLPTS